MCSVIVAARDEADVIGGLLDSLLGQSLPGEFQVIAAANGGSDETATIARRHGADVVETPVPGKAHAINFAERQALGFPRVYVDADVRLDISSLRALRDATVSDGVRAVTARRLLEVDRRSLLIRSYYAINQRLPVYRQTVFGRVSSPCRRVPGCGSTPCPPCWPTTCTWIRCSPPSRKARSWRRSASSAHLVRRAAWSVKLVRVRRANREMRAYSPGPRRG